MRWGAFVTDAPYVEVALPVPLRRVFTYAVPAARREELAVGHRVAVRFSRRKVAGFVVGFRDEPPEGLEEAKIQPIAGVFEREALFPIELLRFLEEAARYYVHPLGEVLRAAAPALPTGAIRALRAEGFLDEDETVKGEKVGRRTELVASIAEAGRHRLETVSTPRLGPTQLRALQLIATATEPLAQSGLAGEVKDPRRVLRRLAELDLVTLTEREKIDDRFFSTPITRDAPPTLHPAQARAVARLREAIAEGGARSFLLHGVTGSGKTEVYLHAIDAAREAGKGALLLVPEIALTPQLVGRLRARFGDELAVLHSELGTKERDLAWRRLRRGELRLAVGARSALFAPVPELGVIVVDEEHDPSFKQEEGFRYHARDMALLRAHRAGALCILGSATPSVESFTRALDDAGGLELLSLPERATAQALPEVEVVDLRRHRAGPSGHSLLSGPLHKALGSCLAAGEQAILFLNRRGFAPQLRCTSCGVGLECPACSVPLTWHRGPGVVRCHYCDFQRPPPERCPSCQSAALEPLGLGTEQLQAHLIEAFPGARVERLDRDVARGAAVEAILAKLRAHEVDILVGTQMVTKGHDLPGVTLVGAILADQSLAFPDFRAGERTFQLLEQVAGRAGRGERAGRVLFQTFSPEQIAIQAAARHDYEAFYRSEVEDRQALAYPPFGHMVAVRVDAGSEAHARRVAEGLASVARRHPGVASGVVRIQGPAPAPIARLRGRWRMRFLVRGEERGAVRSIARALADRIDQGIGAARAHVDVDPVAML